MSEKELPSKYAAPPSSHGSQRLHQPHVRFTSSVESRSVQPSQASSATASRQTNSQGATSIIGSERSRHPPPSSATPSRHASSVKASSTTSSKQSRLRQGPLTTPSRSALSVNAPSSSSSRRSGHSQTPPKPQSIASHSSRLAGQPSIHPGQSSRPPTQHAHSQSAGPPSIHLPSTRASSHHASHRPPSSHHAPSIHTLASSKHSSHQPQSSHHSDPPPSYHSHTSTSTTTSRPQPPDPPRLYSPSLSDPLMTHWTLHQQISYWISVQTGTNYRLSDFDLTKYIPVFATLGCLQHTHGLPSKSENFELLFMKCWLEMMECHKRRTGHQYWRGCCGWGAGQVYFWLRGVPPPGGDVGRGQGRVVVKETEMGQEGGRTVYLPSQRVPVGSKASRASGASRASTARQGWLPPTARSERGVPVNVAAAPSVVASEGNTSSILPGESMSQYTPRQEDRSKAGKKSGQAWSITSSKRQ